MDAIQSKTCTKCGVDKPLSEFYAQKTGKHGRIARCSACLSQVRRAFESSRRESTPTDAKKECTKCGKIKPVADFHLGGGKHGRQPHCRACAAQWQNVNSKKISGDNRRRTTGFSPQDFDTAIRAQDNCCAICHAEFSQLSPRGVNADHDHTTGEKRGLLCAPCNKGLGHFNDSPILLRRAAEYLENPPLRGAL